MTDRSRDLFKLSTIVARFGVVCWVTLTHSFVGAESQRDPKNPSQILVTPSVLTVSTAVVPSEFPHRLSDLNAINSSADAYVASQGSQTKMLFSQRGGLVVYWASWCSFCKTEIERIRRIRGDLLSCGMNVVGIAIEESKEAAQQATRHLGYDFPVFWTRDENQARAIASVDKIPVVLWVDQDGKVLRRSTGRTELSKLLGSLQAHLQSLPLDKGGNCLSQSQKTSRRAAPPPETNTETQPYRIERIDKLTDKLDQEMRSTHDRS